MKTTNQILTDIFALLVASPINALNGAIYKKTRLTGSVLEDCVIHLIPGLNAKFITDGALYVKIFYKDIQNGLTYYEDSINGSAKEQLLIDFSGVLLKNEGLFLLYREPGNLYRSSSRNSPTLCNFKN